MIHDGGAKYHMIRPDKNYSVSMRAFYQNFSSIRRNRPTICQNRSVFSKKSTSPKNICLKKKGRTSHLVVKVLISIISRMVQTVTKLQKVLQSHLNQKQALPNTILQEHSQRTLIVIAVFLFELPNQCRPMSVKDRCATRKKKIKSQKREVTISTLKYNNPNADRDASKRN